MFHKLEHNDTWCTGLGRNSQPPWCAVKEIDYWGQGNDFSTFTPMSVGLSVCRSVGLSVCLFAWWLSKPSYTSLYLSLQTQDVCLWSSAFKWLCQYNSIIWWNKRYVWDAIYNELSWDWGSMDSYQCFSALMQVPTCWKTVMLYSSYDLPLQSLVSTMETYWQASNKPANLVDLVCALLYVQPVSHHVE